MSVLCHCKVTRGAVCKHSAVNTQSTKSNHNTVEKHFTASAGDKVYSHKEEKVFVNKLTTFERTNVGIYSWLTHGSVSMCVSVRVFPLRRNGCSWV